MANTSTISNKLNVFRTKTWPFVLIAASAYAFRAYEYILKPQLYAEDGFIWLADAYNKGLSSLFQPLNGFFHLPERLYGLLFVSIFPLQFAPLAFNLTALGIFCLTIYYLFTPRTQILSTLYQKVFVVICFSLIANVDEFFFNFSNSIFLLGIIGLLIIVAKPAKNTAINILEKTLFALTCFTLPFAWFFLPITLIESIRAKKKNYFFLGAAAAGAIAQLCVYLTSSAERSVVTFQSLLTKHTFIEIYNQIVIPAVRFSRLDYSYSSLGKIGGLIVILSVIACLAAAVLVLKTSNKQTRYLLLFLALMTAAALKSPFIPSGEALDAIKFMSTATGGDRYFIFGIIGLSIIFAKLSDRLSNSKIKYILLASFAVFGIITSFRANSFFVQKNFVDYTQYYSDGINRLNNPNQSEPIVIPENPNGWSITLYPKR